MTKRVHSCIKYGTLFSVIVCIIALIVYVLLDNAYKAINLCLLILRNLLASFVVIFPLGSWEWKSNASFWFERMSSLNWMLIWERSITLPLVNDLNFSHESLKTPWLLWLYRKVMTCYCFNPFSVANLHGWAWALCLLCLNSNWVTGKEFELMAEKQVLKCKALKSAWSPFISGYCTISGYPRS